MIAIKNLGIWLDHAAAHLMEYSAETIETRTIESAFTQHSQGKSLRKSENLGHNKENHQHSEYYKKIGAEILNYDHVLLFGPTNARMELFNVLRADHHYAKIRIETKQADKMTENQEHAFVRNYFQANKSSHVSEEKTS